MGAAFGEVTGDILREVHVSVSRVPLTLTDSQMEVLRPKFLLGTGTTASAYLRDDGKVVKFTMDSQDVTALTRAQGLPHIAELYEAYNLPQKLSGGQQVFAVVVKRYVEFPSPENTYVVLLMRYMRALPPSVAMFDSAVMRPFLRDVRYTLDLPDTTVPEEFARRFHAEIYETVDKLEALGISMSDIHKGNVMYDPDARDWVFIDLGRSLIPAEEAYKVSKTLSGMGRWRASRSP